MDDPPTVLLVDDDEQLLGLYRRYLEDRFAVRTATNGREALDRFDAGVDVVVLDRRMPALSGDDVLGELRERGFDGPVAMVTAVDPGADIVDLPVDDYLVKPVSKEALRKLVGTLTRRAAYDEASRDYFSLVSRLSVLEARRSAAELDDQPAYRQLVTEVADSRDRARSTLDELTADELEALFRGLDASTDPDRWFDRRRE